jgi:scyllo-inositol 2-dehydrogenase (NADP+)
MSREIGVAVIGYGLGGRVFHAPFVSAVPGLRLVGIVSSRAEEIGRAYPGVKVLGSTEEALRLPEVELVVVSTPNETHFAQAKQCLEAGKHVVIDKPFAGTSAEAKELVELAKAKGVLVVPFHNRRWDGDFKTVKKLLGEGAVGRLVTFESHFDRFRPVPRENTWKEAGNPANGMLFDLGPHLVDQCLALFGAPETITASVRADRDQTEIEDAFDITLSYTINGKRLLAHCRTSYLACDNAPRFLLHGTKGSFRKFGLDSQEPKLVSGSKVPAMGSTEVWLQEPESMWGTLTVAPNPADPGTLVTRHIKTELGDYRGFYANVRDAVLGEAELAVKPEHGYQTIKLLEMARESSAKGCTLKVEF